MIPYRLAVATQLNDDELVGGLLNLADLRDPATLLPAERVRLATELALINSRLEDAQAHVDQGLAPRSLLAELLDPGLYATLRDADFGGDRPAESARESFFRELSGLEEFLRELGQEPAPGEFAVPGPTGLAAGNRDVLETVRAGLEPRGSGSRAGRMQAWDRLRINVPVVRKSPPDTVISLAMVTEPEGVWPESLEDAGVVLDGFYLPADHKFRKGVEAGRRLALELLAGYSVAGSVVEEIEKSRFLVLGSKPGLRPSEREGCTLTGGSAALPVALGVLRAAGWMLGFDLGLPRAVASGVLRNGGLQPMDGEYLVRKAEAVRASGYADTLVTPPSPDDFEGVDGFTISAASTLAEAALVMWPETWPKLARRLLEGSRNVGDWVSGPDREGLSLPTVETAGRSRELHVESRLAGELVAEYGSEDPADLRVHILGGPAQSGKSTIGRDVAARLAGRTDDPWRIWWLLRPDLGEESRDTLRAQIRTAASLAPHRTLVILDDIYPRPGATDLDALQDTLRESGTACLVFYDSTFHEGGRLKWKMDRCEPRLAMPRNEAERLVAGIAAEAASALDRPVLPPEKIAEICHNARSDLGLAAVVTIQLTRTGGRREQEALREFAHSRVDRCLELPAEWGIEESQAALSDGWMLRLAVASLLGGSLPLEPIPTQATRVTELRRAMLGQLGAVLMPVAGEGGVERWRIPGRRLAAAVQREAEKRTQGVVSPTGVAVEILAAELEAGDDAAIITLLRGSSMRGLLADVLKDPRISGKAKAWVERLDILSLAQVVGIQRGTGSIGPGAFKRLLAKISQPDSGDGLTVRKLTVALRALRFTRESYGGSDYFRRVTELQKALDTGSEDDPGMARGGLLRSLLAEDTSSVSARVNLMVELSRFLPQGRQLASRLIDRFIGRTDRGIPADYLAAHRALSLVFATGFGTGEGQVEIEDEDGNPVEIEFTSTPDKIRANLPDIVPEIGKLLEIPEQEEDIEILIGWMLLYSRYRNVRWEEGLIPALFGDGAGYSGRSTSAGVQAPQVETALIASEAYQLAGAFRSLTNNDRTLAHHFHYHLGRDSTRRGLLHSRLYGAHRLTDITELVSSIAEVHTLRAYQLLSDDPDLVEWAVELAWRAMDAGEAGKLLTRARELDETYCENLENGFAASFAKALDHRNGQLLDPQTGQIREGEAGFVKRVITLDHRGTRLAYLLRGMEQCGWRGFESIEDDLWNLIWHRTERGHADGPQLLIELARSPLARLNLFSRVRNEPSKEWMKKANWIRNGMGKSSDLDAAASFHDLANLLGGDLVEGRKAGFGGELGGGLIRPNVFEGKPAHRALPFAVAAARTLRRGGETAPGGQLLAAIERDNHWEKRVGRRLTDWILGGVQPEGGAIKSLGSLASIDPERAAAVVADVVGEDSVWKQFEGNLAHTFLIDPETAVGLLGQFDRIRPGSGKTAIRQFREGGFEFWLSPIENEMRSIPDPDRQAFTYSMLTQLGWEQDDGAKEMVWEHGLSLRTSLIRNPRYLRSYLRWFLAWGKPDWSEQFRWDRVAGRMAVGRAVDLARLPALLDTLLGADALKLDLRREWAATLVEYGLLPAIRDDREVLGRFPADALALCQRTLGWRDLVGYVDDPEWIDGLFRDFGQASVDLLRRSWDGAGPFIPWRQAEGLGHLARVVSPEERPRLGLEALESFRPVDPVGTAWALAPVADDRVAVRLREQLEQRFGAEGDSVSPTGRAMAMVAATEIGANDLALEIARPEIWQARPGVLEVLIEAATDETGRNGLREYLARSSGGPGAGQLSAPWDRTGRRAGAVRQLLETLPAP